MKQVIEDILNTIVLPDYEHVICGFEVKEPHERFDTLGNTPFQFMSVTVTFIGGPGTKLWPQTQEIQRMYDDILDEVWDVIYNYTNEGVDVYYKTVKDCGKKNIYLRETKENYSPAGKEIIPNKIVIHKSNPKFRDKILNEGLHVSTGECYKTYAGYGEKCIPAIFATNSTNKRAWFDSTYDDDVWAINTELIPNVRWYKDRHFESTKKHIVTFDNIPLEAIELMREGTGKDLMRESKQKSNYLNMIKNFVEDYKDRDYVCDIEVFYDEEDDYYIVTLWFDPSNMPGGGGVYVTNLRLELTRDVKNYIPIPNIYVGSSGRKGCGEKNINESMSDKNKINLVKKIIYDFNKVSFIKQSTYNDRPLLTVYFNSDDTAANIESWFTHQICDTVKDYTSGEIKCNPSWGPEWRTNRNNPDILIDAILLKYDDEGNVLNENWFKVPSSDYNSLEKVINLVMKKKYGWWKDIKINTLNYIDLYGDVQIEAELTVDEEWGANQWGEFYYNTKFPGNEGWEDNDGYSRRVSLGDITDSTYAEVIRDDLRDIFKYTLNIEVYIMSFRNVYLIFE